MKYKRLIKEMLEEIKEEEDTIFLSQVYTLIKKHLEKQAPISVNEKIE